MKIKQNKINQDEVKQNKINQDEVKQNSQIRAYQLSLKLPKIIKA